MLSRRNEWFGWLGLVLSLGALGWAGCKRGPDFRGQNANPGWPPPQAPVSPLAAPPPGATLNAPIATAPRPQPVAAVPVATPPRSVPIRPTLESAPPSIDSGIPPGPVAQAEPAAAPPVQPQPPVPAALAVDPAAKVRDIYRLAAESYAHIDGYSAQLRRKEVVNGEDKPEEHMLFKFRKQPWSLYFKWVGPEANGRELVFVKGRHENKIHTHLGPKEPAIPFMGRKMALAPDNMLVRSRSRHTITEAGIGHIIEELGQQLASPQARLLRYAGQMSRPEYAQPLDAVEQTLPPGAETSLPRGGRRLVGYDPASHLPVLVLTYDDRNRQVEFYFYEQLQYPVTLTDNDFNPDRLGSR